MTFPGLEMTISKFHDLSRFSMTVRALLLLVQINRLQPNLFKAPFVTRFGLGGDKKRNVSFFNL